jgi:organic hydroperoxide reductase OsmC/OhrA
VRITAHIRNREGEHEVLLSTGGVERGLTIPPRPSGFGSSVNGGELLFLALATCYCNDIHREAAKRGIEIMSLEVDVEGEFHAEGEAASQVEYSAKVVGSASEKELLDLMAWTDRVTEIQDTVRRGVPVILKRREAVQSGSGGQTSG